MKPRKHEIDRDVWRQAKNCVRQATEKQAYTRVLEEVVRVEMLLFRMIWHQIEEPK